MMKKNFGAALFAAALSLLALLPAKASQNSCIMPNTGTVSGLVLVNDITACANSLLTLYSGGSAPSSPQTYMYWVDTSGTPQVLKQYDGTTWMVLGSIDAAGHIWMPPVGGGTAAVTAAATTNLCASAAAVQSVNGTTPITSFGSACVTGIRKTLIFNNATPLTYNATSLIIPGQASYTTAVGDVADLIYLGGGNWRIVSITKIDGGSVVNPSVPLGTIMYGAYGAAPAKFVFGFGQPLTRTSFPGYTTAVTRAQTVTSTNANNTLTSVPNTAGLGAGMPIEGTGIQAGTTIVSVTASTIVMSLNANVTGTPVATVFLTGYGTAGNSTTVGVPDCRDVILAGRGDMGGTDRALLSSTYFGASPLRTMQLGGAESVTLVTGNLPAYTPSGTVTTSSNLSDWVRGTLAGFSATSGASVFQAGATLSSLASQQVVSTSSFNGATQGGTSAPFSKVQPTMTAECIVAVLP